MFFKFVLGFSGKINRIYCKSISILPLIWWSQSSDPNPLGEILLTSLAHSSTAEVWIGSTKKSSRLMLLRSLYLSFFLSLRSIRYITCNDVIRCQPSLEKRHDSGLGLLQRELVLCSATARWMQTSWIVLINICKDYIYIIHLETYL